MGECSLISVNAHLQNNSISIRIEFLDESFNLDEILDRIMKFGCQSH